MSDKGQVTVTGVVTRVSDVEPCLLKSSGNYADKKDVLLTDATGSALLTVWRKASARVFIVGDVVTLTFLTKGTYDGRSITATANTVYDMNPTSEAASIVRTWYTAIASASPVGPVAAASASTVVPSD